MSLVLTAASCLLVLGFLGSIKRAQWPQ
jgi:hypothetical protein